MPAFFSPHHTSCCHCNLHITSTSQQCVNEEHDPKLWFKIFLIYKKYFNFGFLVHESPETAPLIQCSSLLSVSKWKVQSSGLCLLSTTQRKGYFNAPKAVKIKPWSYRCLCSRQKEQGHEWPEPRAKSNSFPQRCPVGGNNNNKKKSPGWAKASVKACSKSEIKPQINGPACLSVPLSLSVLQLQTAQSSFLSWFWLSLCVFCPKYSCPQKHLSRTSVAEQLYSKNKKKVTVKGNTGKTRTPCSNVRRLLPLLFLL